MTALATLPGLLLAATTLAAAPGGLVAEGAWWWSVSPDPGNPVACATCHFEPAAVRGWAASFPKLKPLPPPHARVMTLLQANAEAVARHYRLADSRRAATAITAYLTALGAETVVSPGVAAGQPVFRERIAALAVSVQRGDRLFGLRCGACHRPAEVAARLRGFPRLRAGRAEPVESFLETHHPIGVPLRWESQAAADLLAALVARLAGQPLGRPAIAIRKETP